MKREDMAIAALREIRALDFAKNKDGSTNLYSGPSRFVRAWLIANETLDALDSPGEVA